MGFELDDLDLDFAKTDMNLTINIRQGYISLCRMQKPENWNDRRQNLTNTKSIICKF
jgi:hypothetical protein